MWKNGGSYNIMKMYLTGPSKEKNSISVKLLIHLQKGIGG